MKKLSENDEETIEIIAEQLGKLSETVRKKENQDRIEALKAKLRKRILIETSKTNPRRIQTYQAFPEELEKDVDRALFGVALKSKSKTDSLIPLSSKIQNSEFEELRHTITVQRICPSCKRHESELEGLSVMKHLESCNKEMFEYYVNLGKDAEDYQEWIKESVKEKPKRKLERDQLSKDLEELSEEDLNKLLSKALRKTMKRK